MRHLAEFIHKLSHRKEVVVFREFIKSHKKITLLLCSVIILVGISLFAAAERRQDVSIDPKIEKPKITGVQEAVDPRAIWANELTKSIKKMDQKINRTLQQQSQDHKNSLQELNLKIKELQDKANNAEITKLQNVKIQSMRPIVPKPAPGFAHYEQNLAAFEKKDPEKYVISGSFARAVLLTGVVAETGTESSSSPQPILLRLVDHGIFSKGYKTKQIKEAILIGACHGNISSERAMCRLQSVSLMNVDNEVVERPVEGWVIGEDGRPGVKGDVIDKASDVARMAMLNGILGGMAAFMQNQATAGVYPISPFTGQRNSLTGENAAKAAGSSGVGNALQKLADYAIKRAEQMSPVIIVAAGRTVDVVFKNGFHLKALEQTPQANPVTTVSSTSTSNIQYNSNGNTKDRENGYNEGMKSLDNLTVGQGNF